MCVHVCVLCVCMCANLNNQPQSNHGTHQIKALDDELRKYQAQIKKSKGPTQANLKRRAIDVRGVAGGRARTCMTTPDGSIGSIVWARL
jgi:hypothetical protein